jgi:ferrous iron transport protein A
MLQAFILTLRQGVEAALIAGIPLAYLLKSARNDLRKSEAALGTAFAGSFAGLAPTAPLAPVESIAWARKETENEFDIESPQPCVALIDLEPGEAGTIDHISLPSADEHFLMRIGFFPGAHVRFSRRAPLGDPSIYSVDGTEIALRAETGRYIMVKRGSTSALSDLP